MTCRAYIGVVTAITVRALERRKLTTGVPRGTPQFWDISDYLTHQLIRPPLSITDQATARSEKKFNVVSGIRCPLPYTHYGLHP